jgi:hypothetical protein
MIYRAFYVVCGCGHRNAPDHSPRKGILKVLSGEFTTCRKCGKEFVRIHLSDRPLTKQLVLTVGVANIHPRVTVEGIVRERGLQ